MLTSLVLLDTVFAMAISEQTGERLQEFEVWARR